MKNYRSGTGSQHEVLRPTVDRPDFVPGENSSQDWRHGPAKASFANQNPQHPAPHQVRNEPASGSLNFRKFRHSGNRMSASGRRARRPVCRLIQSFGPEVEQASARILGEMIGQVFIHPEEHHFGLASDDREFDHF